MSNKVYKVHRLHLLAYYFLRSEGVMHILFLQLLEEIQCKQPFEFEGKECVLIFVDILRIPVYDLRSTFKIIAKLVHD